MYNTWPVFLADSCNNAVGKHWKIQNSAKLQFVETPVNNKYWVYDRRSVNDLVFSGITDLKYRYANLQVSLALERDISLKKREWSVFGGGFMRVRFQDWVISNNAETTYYTDLVFKSVYDSLQGIYHQVMVSKRKLENPILASSSNKVSNQSTHFPIHYGILGGVSFPIATHGKWQLKGQATITHDFNISFRGVEDIPTYRQTYLLAGIMLKPSTTKQASQPTPDDLPTQSKTGRKIPLRGFQTGISQHELFSPP